MDSLILTAEFKRLNIAPSDQHLTNIYDFCSIVRRIESDDRNDVSPETSTAKGYYQFTDDSFKTAKNRIARYGINVEEEIITECDKPTQTELFLSNLFQQKGTDIYLRKIIVGRNTSSMEQLYAKFHHTNVDEATQKRMDKYFK